ncbi:DUF2225 domain-containing protein [Treponema sp. OMZ 840]|uniref:DUF2225 domain-containing protein n=1 Tax=Treponema sp. OMZ 840 TaxID=244313 RepID=UPI003D8ADBF2
MNRYKKKEEPKNLAISFYSKQKILCPFCKKQFAREEMLSGGGRMIAGELTDELRRIFEPSVKFGPVYPMIYSVAACPVCHAALLWSDFERFADEESIEAILDNEDARKKSVQTVFPFYDLKRERTLLDGAAAYYLALLCYEKLSHAYSPTIKKAQISLRLAWLSGDLNNLCPDRGFDYIQSRFYRKALFLYQEALDYEINRIENITAIGNFGPDIDKNYGYDGVVYLCALLEYKYGQRQNLNERLQKLGELKRSIARIFGLGKSSKSKPGPLLEHSRDLYDNLTAELKEANVLSFDDDD